MRISLAVLLMIIFFQAVFLPFDLLLLVLAVRFLATDDDLNLYLAFGFGLLASFLLNLPMGSLSLFYLLVLVLLNIIKKIDLFSHWSLALPLTLGVLALGHLWHNYLAGAGLLSGFTWEIWLAQALLVYPAYLIIRFWEERFIPQKEIRLKMG